MFSKIFIIAFALTCLSACGENPFEGATASEIQLRDGQKGSNIVAKVTNQNEILIVLNAFLNSKKISVAPAEKEELLHALRIDFIGNEKIAGPWLYQPKNGVFCMLFNYKKDLFYKMQENDYKRINALYEAKRKQ